MWKATINDTFPFWMSSLQKLQVLVLRSNAFHGPIRQASFGTLKIIDISHNHFIGTLPSDYFLNWSAMSLLGANEGRPYESYMRDRSGYYRDSIILVNKGVELELVRILRTYTAIDFSGNRLEGEIPSSIGLLKELHVLSLSNNAFTDHIPSFICELGSLSILDLSNNDLNGSIPPCLGNLKGTLSVLNLRQNRLSGGLPENVFQSLRSLDVGHNQLVGKLPRSLIHFSNLEVFNVESNNINDTFPLWLSSLQNLQVLVLRSNTFYGTIHQASFHSLKIIDISHNHFNGILPSDYFVKWSNMSSLKANEDLLNESYMGNGYYQDSVVLVIKGVELKYERILKIFVALDFSGNRFEGEIPRSIGLLKELHVLNLSNNAFTGHIPSSMGNLTALESLDVSRNKLSGEIPQELGNLSFLSHMNFSHNQLVGLVPGGTQFRTQPCSSFEYNSGLFGSSLDDDCPSSQQYETPGAKEEEEDEEEEVFSWIAAAIGFGPGAVLGLTIGYVLVFYKPKWFTIPFRRSKHRSTSTTTH
ncbi:unnamed protein product [Microthlaspi erraticum]|uniref:Leucine-rich repeat-containing N-terminal plant-type domain-containing protein n=1 Tax=Microthlaspi erraticum TaxID=1685480 RepID=A0A6D2IYG3_9BRAS|nr:unnamed protein product [Microthlaspi erraticum]